MLDIFKPGKSQVKSDKKSLLKGCVIFLSKLNNSCLHSKKTFINCLEDCSHETIDQLIRSTKIRNANLSFYIFALALHMLILV